MTERIQAGKLSEMQDNELKSLEHEGEKIVFFRHGDQVFAHQCDCTHVGAPLDKGRVTDGRLYCMAHHATFHLDSGMNIEPPALDDLKRYKVEIDGDDVYIHFPAVSPSFPQTVKPEKSPVYIILGGGAAGATAAETLRRSGFQGRVLMISSEATIPYDRTRLSKAVIEKPESDACQPLRSESFYDTLAIERLHATATQLDPDGKILHLDDGKTYPYDKLLIATGSTPRTIEIPGSHLTGIHTLRAPGDAEAINGSAADARQAVIIGGSFIGLECASGLRAQGLEVHVIEQRSAPFEKALGQQLGKRLQSLHEENGVVFHLESSIKAFHGAEKVEKVELESGEMLEAQVVILGLGVKPCTQFLESLELNEDGGITVNADMSVPGTQGKLFAAGDIAAFPWPDSEGKPVRFEHWRTAMQMGQRAARAMAGEQSPEPFIPYFWTRQHKFTLRYVGHAASSSQVSVDGEIDSKDFRVNYFEGGQLRAVAASRKDQEMIAVHEVFRRGHFPLKEQMESSDFDWFDCLNKT